MHAARSLFFALIPLLASCQLFQEQPEPVAAAPVRLQGELTLQNGQWLLRPCLEQRRLELKSSAKSGLTEDAAGLLTPGAPLFADLRGRLAASPSDGSDGQFEVLQRYRLQQGPGCADANFKHLTLQARGLAWSLAVSAKGLVLERPGQAPLVLPYVEEQLPEGRLSLASEANGQRLELWVAPQRCVAEDGGVQHLSAELRLDGQVQRGCAYYGGARNN